MAHSRGCSQGNRCVAPNPCTASPAASIPSPTGCPQRSRFRSTAHLPCLQKHPLMRRLHKPCLPHRSSCGQTWPRPPTPHCPNASTAQVRGGIKDRPLCRRHSVSVSYHCQCQCWGQPRASPQTQPLAVTSASERPRGSQGWWLLSGRAARTRRSLRNTEWSSLSF